MIGLFCLYLYSGSIDEYRIMEDLSDINIDIQPEVMRGESFLLIRNVPNKFSQERFFARYGDTVLLTEGIVINSQQIEGDYQHHLDAQIIAAYRSKSLDKLIGEFRGSFSGIILDDNTDSVTVYLDQLATKTLFYFKFSQGVVIASEVKSIVDFCKLNGLKVSLSMAGAYSMLSYGYMYQDNTLVNEIKRLREGNIYTFKKNDIEINCYHLFPQINEENESLSNDVAIDEINNLFRKGLGLQIEKNKEYGFVDAIPLSAGMDCRMTAFVHRDMEKEPALNFTYSETGQYDFIVPSQMAHDLGNKWLFKSLDHGWDLLNIEESIRIADGLTYYAWPAQLIDFIKCADTRNWGIIHTGVLGDVIIDSFSKVGDPRPYKIGDGAFSLKLIEKLKKYVSESTDIHEHGMIRNRGINGACLGYSLTFRHFTEDLSPFLYIDLFDYCMSIPLCKRQRHRLYYAWVRKYYSKALNYKHNGITPKGILEIRIHRKPYRLRAIPDILMNTIRIKINPNYGMNPLDSWYEENNILRNSMDAYFYENISVVEDWKELYQDTKELYQSGNTKEKIMAISLIGSIKMFFTEDEK